MTDFREITEAESPCPCPLIHPPLLVLDRHHLWPLGWGGPDIADNIVPICPNAHRLAHTLLNRMKKAGSPLSYAEARKYGLVVRSLAERGWKKMIDAGRTPQSIRTYEDLAA